MEKLPLRTDEFETVRKMIASAPFSVDIDGEDIVISVEHFDGTYEEGPEVSSTSVVAFVPLQDIVRASVTTILDTDDEIFETRSRLFALAGLLRESARFIEAEAEAISPQEWRQLNRADLQPVDDKGRPIAEYENPTNQ